MFGLLRSVRRLAESQIKSVRRFAAPQNGQHKGVPFREYLRLVHDAVRPANYFEIGVKSGRTFRLARCPAVAVDPVFRTYAEVDPMGVVGRPETYMFQCTSDQFFSAYTPKQFFPAGVDFAFLDGMHLFEYLLRDFLNTEKYVHPGAIIALHDCHPPIAANAVRDRGKLKGWPGDVWKLLPILQKYRPDVKIRVLDCPSTGLAFVFGLSPHSTTLADHYEEIVAKYTSMTLEDYGLDRLRHEFPALDSRELSTAAAVRTLLERGLNVQAEGLPRRHEGSVVH